MTLVRELVKELASWWMGQILHRVSCKVRIPFQECILSPSKNPLTFANSLSTHISNPTGYRPCNRSWWKTCPIHHPANSITEHTECNAFYLGETSNSFQTVGMDTSSPPQHWTQTYQMPSTYNPTRSLSKNAGLLVSYTNYLTPPQTTSVASLKLNTNLSSNPNTTPVSTSVNPPHSTLAPAALKVSLQSPVFYCWGRPLWSGRNIHFHFVSSLYVLAMLTCGPDNALVSLR